MAVLGLAAITTVTVLLSGWISDDAFITARYADNLLAGHGPVYNLDERVQGYTHPLWFFVFVPTLWLLGEPILVAVVLGGLFTFLTVSLLGWAILRMESRTATGLVLVAGMVLVLILSESWRSFQTSGLENSLTHLLLALLVVEVVRHPEPRVGPLALYCSLLALNRLDLLVLVAPVGLVILIHAFRTRDVRSLLMGGAPLAIWLGFAWAYYDSLLPNTAVSKLGLYSLSEGLARGLTYVADAAIYEPSSAFAVLVLGVIAASKARSNLELALLAGALLYGASTVVSGGDFMRGRMLLAPAFLIVALGAFAVGRLDLDLKMPSFRRGVVLSLTVAVLLASVAPAQAIGIQANGITNERLYYQGQSLSYYIQHGNLRPSSSAVLRDLPLLSHFMQTCGSFGVHANSIGYLGYSLGVDVRVIDRFGLTDAVVARLPRDLLVKNPRPGHPYRDLPVAYLAQRGDISLFEDWRDAAAAADCSIIEAAHALAESPAYYSRNNRVEPDGIRFYQLTTSETTQPH